MVALKLVRGMHRFDPSDWLEEVDVPTLVVAGSEDTFSPPQLGEQLLTLLRDAELITVVGGTHATLIEYPHEVHDAVSDFLHRRLDGPVFVRQGRASLLLGPKIEPDMIRPT